MTIKRNSILRILSFCFFTAALLSCESHEQKADDAFEHVKEEKKIAKDSFTTKQEIPKETKLPEPAKKVETLDDWSKFKMDLEKKILTNETNVKTLKELPGASSKTLRKVSNLEQENNELRNQLEQYTEDAKVRLEKFKTQTNHDVNQIGIELKDILVNNKG